MRKSAFCICKIKDADQHLRFRYIDSTGCFIISVLIIHFNGANSLYDILINNAPFSSTLNNIFICTLIWELFDVMASFMTSFSVGCYLKTAPLEEECFVGIKLYYHRKYLKLLLKL